MKGPYVIGIDGGTQSTKVLVVDAIGNVVSQGQTALRTMNMPRPGVAEHPADDLWTSLQSACQQALANFSGDPSEIVAIGLCSIRFCRALLNGDGTLAHPVLSWMDERVSLPHQRQDFPGARYVTAASAYVTARLVGRVVDSVANYAGIWPVDHETWDWSGDDAAIAAFGVERGMLPELVLPGELLGEVTQKASALTGLPVGLPVFATANDKATEAFGNGVVNPDTLLLSLGTYIATMKPAGRTRRDGDDHWSNFACLPQEYLDESGGIRRGMWTITWLRSLLGDEIKRQSTVANLSVEDYMNAAAAQVSPGSNGLLTVLDWLAPTDQPHRRGAMVGFDARHDWPHIYRSMLEGIAMTMRSRGGAMLDALGEPVTRVLVAGGGSGSDPMMQIVADVFDLPASRTVVNNAAGLGSAICAAAGAGVHADLRAAASAMVQVRDVFEPNPTNVQLYSQLRAAYDKLPESLEPVLKKTHEIGM